MKILQLIERQIDTTTEDKTYRGRLRGSNRTHNSSFSTGREHKTDPHIYQKYGHTPMRKGQSDGYDIFIRYLIEHDIDNPHFPNVYNIKRITDKGGSHITKFDVEKLLPYQALSAQELLEVIKHTFKSNDDIERFIIQKENAIKRRKHYSDDEEELKKQIAIEISNLFYLSDTSNVQLDSLKEAAAILVKIQREKHLLEDLHLDNIMYRRTAHGIQLVLNDPFAFQTAQHSV